MKDKNTAWILAIFIWGLGIHKFYLNNMTAWIIYLLLSRTFIPSIIWFIEWLSLFLMSKEKFDKKYNAEGNDNDENRKLRDKVERLRLQKEYEKLSKTDRPTGFIPDRNKE